MRQFTLGYLDWPNRSQQQVFSRNVHTNIRTNLEKLSIALCARFPLHQTQPRFLMGLESRAKSFQNNSLQSCILWVWRKGVATKEHNWRAGKANDALIISNFKVFTSPIEGFRSFSTVCSSFFIPVSRSRFKDFWLTLYWPYHTLVQRVSVCVSVLSQMRVEYLYALPPTKAIILLRRRRFTWGLLSVCLYRCDLWESSCEPSPTRMGTTFSFHHSNTLDIHYFVPFAAGTLLRLTQPRPRYRIDFIEKFSKILEECKQRGEPIWVASKF